SVSTAAGTASVTTFTTVAATPPGNALAFDGSDDYVAFGSTPAVNNLGPGSFSMEAWVYYDGGTGAESIIRKDGDYNFYINGNKLHTEVWSSGTGSPTWQRIDGTATTLPANRWAHVAAVWNGSTMQLYINGAAEASTVTTSNISASANLTLGKSVIYGNLLNGRLDEVRIYTAALTQAQVQADMLSTASAVPASLKFYASFDQGTPSGANTGQTTLYDQSSNAYAGTLTNFNSPGLTNGNSTSNWVESYALVVPTAAAATARTATGFTANWTAPAVGTVDNGYRLDVSASSTFASGVTTYTVSSGTSQAITGLTANATYYYRVRADKTSVTGQGAYSNTVTACPAPVAAAQNASVTLDVSGNATLAATAVNNGSTANCGAATAAALSVSPSNFSCADVVPATVASALSFNGSGQYVAIGNTATVPLGNSAYTIEAWIKPNQMGDYGIIGWGNYGFNDQVNALRLYPGGIHNYWWAHDLSGATGNLAGTWHHVAATFDGTTRRIYLDGALLNSDAPGSSHAVPNANNLRIGSTNNGEYFPGSIDEVRVWSVARTQAQLNTAKGIGLPGGTTGLVAYYRLNEGSGLNTADATGNAANLGTLTNGPTWTTDAAPVMNGSPVTLTVTDTGGNTSTAPAVVTVRDNAAPAATGSGPLPAAPTLATSNVPEAGNYGVLYQYDVPNVASLNGLSAIPYTVNNSGVSIATPARVAYFMELSNGTSSKWVWASMDNFASTLTQLGLPNPTANNVNFHRNVTNLNVFSSAGAGVTTGTGIGTGRIEMWYWNYGTGNTDNVPGASGSTYDFGDDPNVGSGNYGSFQVHNVTAGQTLLAYNNWGGNGDGGGIGNIGIGNQVGGSGNPDWTFTYNANAYTVKRIYILVPNNGAFTQPATVALNASGTATLTQSQVYTGAADNCAVSSVVITPSTFTCAQTSAPQLVTVAVSDASGNTTTQSAYVTVTVPPTTTTTWNGSSSSTWTDCANWSYGKVPDASTSVVIPTGQPRYPVLATGTAPVLDLTVNSGGSLTLNSGATLQVNGSFASSGTATLSGTVAFVGSAATQMLNVGTGFNTVTVNKPSGTVQLAQNLTINTALTLTSGTLTTTGSYQVNLGGSASLSESDASYVLGKVVVNRTLAPGTAETFAGLGLTLTPAAGSVAP
ncbi:LamG-like jellyroll fold domain-containing protein, partial [Hymenobacter agri]